MNPVGIVVVIIIFVDSLLHFGQLNLDFRFSPAIGFTRLKLIGFHFIIPNL